MEGVGGERARELSRAHHSLPNEEAQRDDERGVDLVNGIVQFSQNLKEYVER